MSPRVVTLFHRIAHPEHGGVALATRVARPEHGCDGRGELTR